MDLELTEDQAKAENLIVDWFTNSASQTFVLTGCAGTGKTTILRHVVLEKLKLVPDESVSYVTPTGKAATALIREGVPATTLHRLIYQSTTEMQEVNINGKTITVEKVIFHRREKIDKAIKLIVLDEASMVSNETLGDILGYGVKILICGDNAQLPPVEGFNDFLKEPSFSLETIVRQQQGNPIIKLSQLARAGKYIGYGKYGDTVSVIRRADFVGEKRKGALLRADQIICGTNRTRQMINDEVRSYLGFGALPEDGDKLICTQNNWETFIDAEMRFNVVNGLIGTARDPYYLNGQFIGFVTFKPDFLEENCPEALPFDTGIFELGQYKYFRGDMFERFDESGEPVGAFSLNRFEYGYCISCHKAQGSEFDNVVVFDESFAFKEEKFRWLYTAITRAKKKLVIVK